MKNWLKNIPDSTLICNINLPGTHNSCARVIDLPYFSKCQDLSICGQLGAGIRFFDIRVEVDNDRIKTVHAFLDCRKKAFSRKKLMLDDVISDISSFLKNNPSETVLLCFKTDHGISSKETYNIFYKNYVCKSNLFFTENRIPALGEVRGKIVLLNRCEPDVSIFNDFTGGINLSGWPDQSSDKCLPGTETPIKSFEKQKINGSYFLQDFYALPRKAKWTDAVLPAVNNARSYEGFVFNFFSANNFFTSPQIYKKYLFKRFVSVPLNKGQKYGWLIFDFPDDEVIRKIIETN